MAAKMACSSLLRISEWVLVCTPRKGVGEEVWDTRVNLSFLVMAHCLGLDWSLCAMHSHESGQKL